MSRISVPHLQPVLAGLITACVGFSSAFALVLTGLDAVGADRDQAVSGLLLLCVGSAALAVFFGLRLRQPISFAWSTPGAALLAAAGTQSGGYPAAIGAFLLCGLLITVTGLWDRLGRLIAAIPAPVATALLAGVLLPLCLAPVHAAVRYPALTWPVIGVWALLTRFARRWATPGALLATVVVLAVRPDTRFGPAGDLVPQPVFTAPAFSLGAVVSIALPLYVITMAGQNIPGLALLRHYGYRPPARPLLTATGLATAVGALGSAFTLNLAAISAALCAGPTAGPDRSKRWIASVSAAVVYVLLGLGAGASAALLATAPPLLVEAIAGLALLPTLGSALTSSLSAPESREAAVLTFAVTASGITAFGIGAPFWALVTGLAAYRLLPGERPAAAPETERPLPARRDGGEGDQPARVGPTAPREDGEGL